MSDTMFTPGPWSAIAPMLVSGGAHPICEIERGEWGDTFPNIRLEGDGLSRVAVPFTDIIPHGDIPMAEAHANAYLIAAAPDMYEALEAAILEYGKPGGPWNVPSSPGTWIDKAKAALVKARGEA